MIHVELHKTYKTQQAHCALPAKPSLHSFISSQQNTDENSFFSLNMVTSSCSLRGDIYVTMGLHSDDKKSDRILTWTFFSTSLWDWSG
jgi:hypothetical protein